MTSIFEITDWAHVASFFVWTLAVCAVAKAIFGSFPAAELQYRLALRDNPRRQRLNRLNWEVANRTKWDEDVARGSPNPSSTPAAPSFNASLAPRCPDGHSSTSSAAGPARPSGRPS